MNMMLRRLRDAVLWFRDIDYDSSHNIDWLDDFDPSEQRIPKGQPGGGQWTSEGGAAAAASVPTPGTIQVGKQGSAKKLAEYVAHHLTVGTDPNEVAAKLKAYGANYNYSGYAGYANQLLKHVEAAHGLPAGTLGKAVSKKIAELTAAGGGPPAPTDAEMQSMAAVAGEPDKPAEPEPAKPDVPDLPPPGAHPNVQSVAEIVGNKWTPEEKVAWIEALAGDIPPDDTAGQAYVQGQIAKLKGGDVPATSGATPAAAPLTAQEKWAIGQGPDPAAAAAPTKFATDPSGLPMPDEPPGFSTQTSLYKIATDPTKSNAEIIEAIKADMGTGYSYEGNADYANALMAALGGDAKAANAAPDVPSYPDATPVTGSTLDPPQLKTQSKIYDIFHGLGSYSGLKTENKILAIESILQNATHPPNVAYAEQAIALLKGQTPSAPVATPAAAPEMTGEEEQAQAALLSALPHPSPFKPWQGEVWQVASNPTISVEGKVAEINQKLAQMSLPDDQEFAKKALAALAAPAATPAAAEATGPNLNQTLGPNQHAALQKALPMPGGPQAEQDLWETAAMGGNWTAAKKIAQLEADMSAGGIADPNSGSLTAGQTNEYAQDLVKFLKGYDPEAGAGVAPVAPDLADLPEPPDPLSSVQKNLLGDVQNAQTQAEKIEAINNIINGGYSYESTQYAKALLAAVQPGGAATPAAAPTAIPEIPDALKGFGVAHNIYSMAQGTLNTAAQLQDYVDSQSSVAPGSEAETYVNSVIAAKKAQEGGAAPPQAPGPQPVQQPAPPADWPQAPGGIGGNTFVQNLSALATGGGNTSAQLQDYFDNKLALGEIFPDGEVSNYAKKIIAWKEAQEGGALMQKLGPPPSMGALPLPDPTIAGTTFPQDAYDVATKTPGSNTDKLLTLAKWNTAAIKNGSYFEQSPVGVYVKSLIQALADQTPSGQPSTVVTPAPTAIPEVPNDLVANYPKIVTLYAKAMNAANSSSDLEGYIQGLSPAQIPLMGPGADYVKSVIAAKKAQEAGGTPAAPPIPMYAGSSTSAQGSVWGIATNPYIEHSEKITQIQAKSFTQPDNLKYQSDVLAALNAGAGKTSAIPVAGLNITPSSTPAAPALPAPTNTASVQQSIHGFANDPNLTNAEKIAKIAAFPIFGPNNVKYKVALLSALGASASDMIPKTEKGPTTLQGKVYKAATAPYLTPTQKIASVNSLTLATKEGKKYQGAVVAALEGMQAALQASAPAAPKKPPEPPPPLPTAEPGSNTQTSMFAVANKSVYDITPLNNEEKIAEITKILANSSGGQGGKAETYANSLITALGGKPTTKNDAVAAQPQAAPAAPSPSYGGGTKATSGGTAGEAGGPPLRSANPKILARGEKIWNAAAKIYGIKNTEAAVIAPSLASSFWPKVPSSTKSTITSYVGSGSGTINSALRDPLSASKATADKIHGIEDAFDMPEAKVTKDVIMTRGLGMDKSEIDKLKKYLELGLPAKYFMQGYGSSSMHPTTPAFDQRPVWLEMVVRKGTPALGVGAISGLPENELILRHGQLFDVHEIREEKGKIKIRMVSRPPADTGDSAWRKR